MIDFTSQQPGDKTNVLWGKMLTPNDPSILAVRIHCKVGLGYVSHIVIAGPFSFQSNPFLTYLIVLVLVLISGTKDSV